MQQYAQAPLFGATQPFAGNTYNIAGSGVSSSASTIVLTSLTIKQTGQPILTSDLVGTGGTFYVTLEPGSNSRQEIVGCTSVTQGGSSVSLNGCTRGLSPLYPYAASSSLQFVHAGGTQVIFSDPPQLFNQYAALANTQYITGAWGFQLTAPTSTICASGTDLCNKNYVDNVARAGVATSTETNGGQVRLGTLNEQANTYNGLPTDPAVLQTKYSTSTCQVVGSYNIVASSTTGKLDKGCFDQTASYLLTGSTTINARFTSSATTTIAASATSTNALCLNGLCYAFPPTGGTVASSSVLKTDGHATNPSLSWAPPVNVQYSYATTSGSITGANAYATSTGFFSIPAGILTSSSTIHARFVFSCQDTSGSAGKSCTVYLRNSAGVSFCSTAATTPISATTNFYSDIMITPNSSLTSQSCLALSGPIDNVLATGGGGPSTSAINLSAILNFAVVIQGNAANSVSVLNGYEIDVRP